MDQWKAIIATLMIFGSGVGTGHLLTRQTAPENPPRHKTAPLDFNHNPMARKRGRRGPSFSVHPVIWIATLN